MRILIQRVSEARVKIEGQTAGEISHGLLLLLGVGKEDSMDDVQWLAKKVSQLRVFSDEEGKMNLDIQEAEGNALVVSQFTLHAKTKKGNRPSYIHAAHPEEAIPLYEAFKKELSTLLGRPTASGQFGADMQVELINDGPVTIWIDSKNKE